MDNGKFEAWLERVNQRVGELVGLDLGDLPDCAFADWFEDGVAPFVAAKRVIKAAGAEW